MHRRRHCCAFIPMQSDTDSQSSVSQKETNKSVRQKDTDKHEETHIDSQARTQIRMCLLDSRQFDMTPLWVCAPSITCLDQQNGPCITTGITKCMAALDVQRLLCDYTLHSNHCCQWQIHRNDAYAGHVRPKPCYYGKTRSHQEGWKAVTGEHPQCWHPPF